MAKKRRIFSWYEERLSNLPGVTLNAQPEGMINSYWMVTIVLDPALAQAKGLDKARLMALFKAQNIDTRPFFSPLSSIPAYADTEEGTKARARNVASYAIGPCGLNLPCGMSLTEAQAERVCATLADILNAKPAA